MITDNYAINNAILDFVEQQSIPNLSDDIYLELAPKFDDYQAPFFLYKTKASADLPDLYSVKSDLNQIEYVEEKDLNLSDEQINSGIAKVHEKFKQEYDQEINSLSLNWVFEISEDLSLVKIMDDKPEEDLIWADNASTEFIEYVEENLNSSEINLSGIEDLDSLEIQQRLNLEKLWSDFKPESRWYLYTWKRDPQSALQEIVNAIDDYINKLDSDNVALEIYDLYA